MQDYMFLYVLICLYISYSYQSHQRNLRDRQQSERQQEAAAGEADDISVENVQEPIGENEERNDIPSSVPNADNESSTPLASSSDEQVENRLPAITLLRTFILSFFSSLIPETPAV